MVERVSSDVTWDVLKSADREGRVLFIPQLVQNWPALRLWSKEGSDGLTGIERIKQLTSPTATITVMHSENEIFMGDLHVYTPMPMR